jgi:hypothetical protein
MRTCKTTDKQIDFIIKGINRFISFVNNHYSDCFVYYEDMEETNETYRRSPSTFFDDIEISRERFFDGLACYRLLNTANNIVDDIRDVHNVVINMFIDPKGDEYPVKIMEWLYDFRYFCYDSNGNLLSIEEQNDRLKNYPHFDASVKRPQCYNTQ